jgi:hypothetical protein
MRTIEQRDGIWRLSLEQIEATVADYLGPGRVPGNQAGPRFSRQISMYVAKHVGGWSTTRIGRFYNGRHHTTVLKVIRKIECVRRTDESIGALIEVLTAALSPNKESRYSPPLSSDELVRRRPNNSHQDFAYGTTSLVLCGRPIRGLPGGLSVYPPNRSFLPGPWGSPVRCSIRDSPILI